MSIARGLWSVKAAGCELKLELGACGQCRSSLLFFLNDGLVGAGDLMCKQGVRELQLEQVVEVDIRPREQSGLFTCLFIFVKYRIGR